MSVPPAGAPPAGVPPAGVPLAGVLAGRLHARACNLPARTISISRGGGITRVGVTGHRWVTDATDGLGGAIDRLLDEIESLTDSGGAACALVTGLADGADRCAAMVALERGWQVEAVLPLPVDEYRHDFDPASDREFRRLLRRCASVEVVDAGGSEREDGYLAAGVAMVERSQIVVTVWDGAPPRGRGGTAEIVDLARRRERPMVWIEVERGGSGDPGRVVGVVRERWWEQ